MTDKLEFQCRILDLKKATLVMAALADSFKNKSAKQETKSLALTISWAVRELERLNAENLTVN